jgi:hypothetical protein
MRKRIFGAVLHLLGWFFPRSFEERNVFYPQRYEWIQGLITLQMKELYPFERSISNYPITVIQKSSIVNTKTGLKRSPWALAFPVRKAANFLQHLSRFLRLDLQLATRLGGEVEILNWLCWETTLLSLSLVVCLSPLPLQQIKIKKNPARVTRYSRKHSPSLDF